MTMSQSTISRDLDGEPSEPPTEELLGTRLADLPLAVQCLGEDLIRRLELHGNHSVASLFWHEQTWFLNPFRRQWLTEAEADLIIELMETISLEFPFDPNAFLMQMVSTESHWEFRSSRSEGSGGTRLCAPPPKFPAQSR